MSDQIAQFERAIRAQELVEIVEALNAQVNSTDYPMAVSPMAIYCAKTGQPIGTITNDTLAQTFDLHGREAVINLLLVANCHAVHPAWIKTAQQSDEGYNTILDKLCELNPQAYAAYSLGLITQAWLKTRNKHQKHALQNDFHWALARAYQILGFLTKTEQSELCESLCSLLTYAPMSLHYLNRVMNNRLGAPDTIARQAVSKQLLANIDKALAATFDGAQATQRAKDGEDVKDQGCKDAPRYKTIEEQILDEAATFKAGKAVYKIKKTIVKIRQEYFETYTHIAKTIADAARGPSHIRLQRLSHQKRNNAELRAKKKANTEKIDELAALFAQRLGETVVNPGSETWRNRFARGDQAKIAQAVQELLDEERENREDVSLDDLLNSDEATMRRVTWAELGVQGAKLLEERAKLEAQMQAAPSIPAANRFARKPVAPVEPPKEPTKTINFPSRFIRKPKG